MGGVARLFDFGGTLNSYNISATGELADARAFDQDWKAIGDDMRAVLAAYQKEQECKENV
jgi:putative NADH-flavin reductase